MYPEVPQGLSWHLNREKPQLWQGAQNENWPPLNTESYDRMLVSILESETQKGYLT